MQEYSDRRHGQHVVQVDQRAAKCERARQDTGGKITEPCSIMDDF